jgi:hypothetical protein
MLGDKANDRAELREELKSEGRYPKSLQQETTV